MLPDDTAIHQIFCLKVLNVLPYQLRKRWDRLIFSGRAGALVTVNSVTEMKQRVAATPGAIGYIAKEHLDDTVAVVEMTQ